MRTRTIVLALLLISAFFAGFALAQESPELEGHTLIAVNVRSGSGIDYDVRTTLRSGDSVTIIGRSADALAECAPLEDGLNLNAGWLLVEYVGVPGWITRCAIEVDGDIAALPIVTTPELTPEVTAESTEEAQDTPRFPPRISNFYITYGDLPYPVGQTRTVVNVRVEPDIEAEILQVIAASSYVYITGESDDGAWYGVQYDLFENRQRVTKEGWIARHLITNLQFR
jgi:uncharacterized protein YgiM (DUF1202 family)